jgi:hypothetical protein
VAQDESKNPLLNGAHKTPELCACAIGSDVQVADKAAPFPVFSLFRPKAQRKVLTHFCLSLDFLGVHMPSAERAKGSQYIQYIYPQGPQAAAGSFAPRAACSPRA